MRKCLLLAIVLCAWPSQAAAAPVMLLQRDGHAVLRDDPFLTLPALTPRPSAPARKALATPARANRTVRSELTRLLAGHLIALGDYRRYSASFNAALASARRLRGTRHVELQAVIDNLHAIAAGGLLTPSRLPALFQTLDRNRQWWSAAPLPSAGQRVEFAGSELVWEYYPGQGIELQQLGSFGKADGLYTAGRSQYGRMRNLLGELIALAANRGGGLAWEYYFNFDGGSPPWTSAMSQGTALEALTRAYRAFKDRSYLQIASRALPIFSLAPPVGVSVKTRIGTRYLLYSFSPGTAVINGFLQTLIGLYDYAHVSRSSQAGALFARGDREARAELPRYDTGAWSLYQPGEEATLDYHTLVTGFLQGLCARTHAAVYCRTAARFGAYLRTPPALELLTNHVPANRSSWVRFRLSKYSHVGIVVRLGAQSVFLTSAYFPYGVSSFSLPPLGHRGRYTIRLAATDLAGNFNRTTGTLNVP